MCVVVSRVGRICVVLAFLIAPASALARDGGPGPDIIRGTVRADTIHGDGGPDRIAGGRGADVLTGDTGPDRLDGGADDDVLTGASGRDVIVGRDGGDVISGGFGADAIAGGDGDDVINGDNDDDTIFGGRGDDVIHGGSGTDAIDGGPGDDVLFSDSGPDVLHGGEGNDELIVDAAGRRALDCGGGDDTVVLLVGDAPLLSTAVPADCEHIYTTSAALQPDRGVTRLLPDGGARVTGTAKDDTLLGGPGPDRLRGLGGNDVLWGLRQPDTPSTAPDAIDGGDGDDTIYGGKSRDTLTGGSGADTFVFRDGEAEVVAGAPRNLADLITDFSHADGDKISLSAIDAIVGGGDDKFTFIGENKFSGTAGELRFIHVGSETFVFGDTNGDKIDDFRVQLHGTLDLVASDFQL